MKKEDKIIQGIRIVMELQRYYFFGLGAIICYCTGSLLALQGYLIYGAGWCIPVIYCICRAGKINKEIEELTAK